MTDAYELAQLNIGRPLAALDSDVMAEFVAGLAPINALADAAPGFVWRLQDDAGDATSFRGFGDESILVNMSTWASLDALADFVYRSAHTAYLRRRRSWFERMDVYAVLWWVPAGHRPTLAEAEERLITLQNDGPSPRAFTFQQPFPPPGVAAAAIAREDDACPVT
jgi:Domain of unknown function (DUF3291)